MTSPRLPPGDANVITADSITDEQVVALHNASLSEHDFETARVCDDALKLSARYAPDERRHARARCAAILRARQAASKQRMDPSC